MSRVAELPKFAELWPKRPRSFRIECPIRYKCYTGVRVFVAGTGKTLEIGSREITFTTPQPLKEGEYVFMSVDWPARLDNTIPLRLEIYGRVSRSGRDSATVKFGRYEFRTSRSAMQGAGPQS